VETNGAFGTYLDKSGAKVSPGVYADAESDSKRRSWMTQALDRGEFLMSRVWSSWIFAASSLTALSRFASSLSDLCLARRHLNSDPSGGLEVEAAAPARMHLPDYALLDRRSRRRTRSSLPQRGAAPRAP